MDVAAPTGEEVDDINMETKTRWMKHYLIAFGLLNVFVISFTVPLFFGELLLWQPRNLPVEMMLSSIYLAMGLVVLAASRKPRNHKALIDFLVLANLGHAFVMLLFAENARHVLDAIAIGLLGGLPLFFYPWGVRQFMRY